MPNDVHSGVVEVAGDVPRSAANVGNGPGTVHQLGEQRQARAEVWPSTEQSTYLLDVSGSVGVIRRAGGGEPVIGHGRHGSPIRRRPAPPQHAPDPAFADTHIA